VPDRSKFGPSSLNHQQASSDAHPRKPIAPSVAPTPPTWARQQRRAEKCGDSDRSADGHACAPWIFSLQYCKLYTIAPERDQRAISAEILRRPSTSNHLVTAGCRHFPQSRGEVRARRAHHPYRNTQLVIPPCAEFLLVCPTGAKDHPVVFRRDRTTCVVTWQSRITPPDARLAAMLGA